MISSFVRLIALLCLTAAAASHAAVFQNVVTNGTFTVASGQAGSGWTGSYSQRSSGPTLNGGGNYFFAGAVSSREVNQIYTLTASEQALCKGAVGITVRGMRYFLSADLFGYQDQNDYSRVIVEFRNAAGTVLTSHTLDSRSTRPATWASTLTAGQAPNYQSGSGWAPLGTTSVRIRVIATRAQGDNNDGYVDNVRFELRPSNVMKVPSAGGDVVRIAPGQIETHNAARYSQVAAAYHNLALKSDGTVVAWGYNEYGQSSVPAGLSGVTAIGAGIYHSLALKSDGTVVAWGYNNYGQSSLPAGLTGVTAIAAGTFGSAAKLSNGRWITWGQAPSTTDDPWWARNVLEISSGPYGLSHVIRSTQPQAPHRLFLAKGALWENSGDVHDTLWPDDPNRLGGHSYQLIAGEGDDDNGLFTLTGQTLTLTAAVDYEQKSSYRLRARVTDSSGFSHEQALVLAVVDDDLEDADNDGLTQAQESALGTSDLIADTDGDSYLDGADAFPLDSTEWLDTDGDGIGNNADPDDDNDGAVDAIDAFPLDAQEMVDSDGDGIGNNSDPDDDNDGIADAEDATPEGTNPARLDLAFGTIGRVRFPMGSSDDLGHGVALQADGRIVVAGAIWNGSNMDFGVARFLPDGSPDTSFSGDGKVITSIGSSSEFAQCVAVQADGKIVVAGHSFNGSNLDVAVVRYTAAGVLDTTFSGDGIFTLDLAGGEDRVNAIHVQSDGKILLAGDSGPIGAGQFALMRLTSTGALDTTFGGGTGRVLTGFGEGYVAGWAMAVQDDGKIVMAGEANGDFALARYLADGSPDPSFNGTGQVVTDVSGSWSYDYARAVTFHRDGKIIVAGNTQNGTTLDVAVIRYTPEGQLDAGFGGDGIVVTDVAGDNDSAFAVAVRDDKILVAGTTKSSQDDDYLLMRFTETGSLDSAFNGNGIAVTKVGNGNDLALAMAVQPDGKIVMAGFSSNGTDADFALVRHMGDPPVPKIVVEHSYGDKLADDSSILVFHTTPVGAPLPDSKSLVIRNTGEALLNPLLFSIEGPGADHFQLDTSSTATSVPRNGSTTFGVMFSPTAPGFHAAVLKITSNDPDESPFEIHMSGYANGSVTFHEGFGINGVVRTSFSTNPFIPLNEYGNAMAIQAEGKIVVVGRAEDAGTSDAIIARYHPNGVLDASFNTGGRVIAAWPGFTNSANAVAIQNDGNIVVAGYSGSDFVLARYTSLGAPDVSFGGGVVLTDFAGSTDAAEAMALLPDGRILVAGRAMVGGRNRFALACYLDNGALDPSFGTAGKVTTAFDGQASAYGMAIDTNGRVILAGHHIGAVPGVAVACYLPDGSLDPSFGAGGKLVTQVDLEGIGMSVAVQPNGRILVGGSTSSSNLLPSHFLLIRYLSDGGLDTDFNGTGIATASNGAMADFRYGFSLALQSDGRILLGGSTASDFTLARFTPYGMLDTTFHGTGMVDIKLSYTGPSFGRSVAVRSDGDILMAGSSTSEIDYTQDLTLIRLDGTGAANQAPVAHAGGPYVIAPGDGVTLNASLSSDPDATPGSGIISYAWMIGEGPHFDDAGGPTPQLTWEMLNQNGITGPGSYLVRLKVTDAHGYSDTDDATLVVNGTPPTPGELDPLFGTGGKAFAYSGRPFWEQNDTAHAVAIQADGKIVVAGQSGGDFALARFSPEGLLDSGFNGDGKLTTPLPGVEDSAYAVAIQTDGKIVAAGSSGNDFAIVRYTEAGVPDVGFSGGMVITDFGGADSGQAMALQSDGKIIVAGWAQIGPQFHFAIARYLQNGLPDPSFGVDGKVTTAFNGNAYGHSVAVQDDGRIVVAGHLTGGTNSGVAVARYLQDGTLDTAFAGTGKLVTTILGEGIGMDVLIQPDGKILVGGSTSSSLMQITSFLAVRYLPDGTLDSDFNGSGIAIVNNGTEFDIRSGFGIALQSDGRILLAGNTMSDFSLARLTANGALDTTFRGGGLFDIDLGNYEDSCRGIALQADGRIILVGSSVTQQLARTQFAVVRIENERVTPVPGFQSAMAAAGLAGPAAAAEAIPFGDGVPNLLKYAFNMNLAGPDSSRLQADIGTSGLPFSRISTEEGVPMFQVQYLRRRNGDMEYTPMVSDSLDVNSFVPINAAETVQPIDDDWERVIITQPINSNTIPRLFVTVKVSLN